MFGIVPTLVLGASGRTEWVPDASGLDGVAASELSVSFDLSRPISQRLNRSFNIVHEVMVEKVSWRLWK